MEAVVRAPPQSAGMSTLKRDVWTGFGASGAFKLARMNNASVYLDKQGLPAGKELREWLSTPSSFKRGNPSARRQLRDLKEGDPYSLNHGETRVSHLPQAGSRCWTGHELLRLGGYPSISADQQCPTRQGSTDSLTPI
jgi:hypothetical protein